MKAKIVISLFLVLLLLNGCSRQFKESISQLGTYRQSVDNTESIMYLTHSPGLAILKSKEKQVGPEGTIEESFCYYLVEASDSYEQQDNVNYVGGVKDKINTYWINKISLMSFPVKGLVCGKGYRDPSDEEIFSLGSSDFLNAVEEPTVFFLAHGHSVKIFSTKQDLLLALKKDFSINHIALLPVSEVYARMVSRKKRHLNRPHQYRGADTIK